MADRAVLEFNGTFFELKVVSRLKSSFPEATILHNVSLYCAYLGKDTQVDVIMIHPCGVFVIEAKGWRKWIAGNYGDSVWKGRSGGVDVMRVYSPLDQNFLHIRTLRNALRMKGQLPPSFHNLVCVPDGTDIYSNCNELMNLSMIEGYIRSIARRNKAYINVDEMSKSLLEVTTQLNPGK